MKLARLLKGAYILRKGGLEATDPRDCVFALLRIIVDAADLHIAPDYSKSKARSVRMLRWRSSDRYSSKCLVGVTSRYAQEKTAISLHGSLARIVRSQGHFATSEKIMTLGIWLLETASLNFNSSTPATSF